MYPMGSVNSKGTQMIPANGARLTMIFEQRVPTQELQVVKLTNYYIALLTL